MNDPVPEWGLYLTFWDTVAWHTALRGPCIVRYSKYMQISKAGSKLLRFMAKMSG